MRINVLTMAHRRSLQLTGVNSPAPFSDLTAPDCAAPFGGVPILGIEIR
jgi:hypothetical protein